MPILTRKIYFVRCSYQHSLVEIANQLALGCRFSALDHLMPKAQHLMPGIYMKIKPLGDRVLIEPLREEKKRGGIILPDTVEKERPEQGRIVSVGPGRVDDDGKKVPMNVKKGDKVLFTKYGPNEIKVDEKEYLIAKEEDILAVIE
ncbi:MAG: co-chaperone GroES [Candidatus Paceibacterota bacterium]